MILPESIQARLRPWQPDPVCHLLEVLKQYRTACDLSDTGTGKTYVAAAVAAMAKLPTLVVVPKIAISQWQRAAEHFGDSFSVVNYEMLRTGRTPFGKWDNTPPAGFVSEEYLQCEWCQLKVDLKNFQPCYCHPSGTHCVNVKKKSWRYGNFHFSPRVRFVIFDEAHRCNGEDSLNADLLIAAKRDVPYGLALTATMACDPMHMRALGYFLDLHGLDNEVYGRVLKPKFTTWAARHGVRRESQRGLQWRVSEENQLATMDLIRQEIIPARGVRITTESIPNFPKRVITSELYDLEANGRIDALYTEMAGALQRLADRKATDVDPNLQLTAILRARQEIELLKVPIAVELARDYVARGHQVGVFVNFTDTLAELSERLQTRCWIRGGQSRAERDRIVKTFQTGKEPVILINNEAGGAALDLPGDNRVGLVFPPEKAVTFKQLVGRFHRDGGGNCFYRVLFAANTVEVRQHRNLQKKLNNLDALNDGDLNPCNLFLSK